MDSTEDEERCARRRRRRAWPGGLVAAQTEAQRATPEERLATMWRLALDAWSVSGRALPRYDRASMPGRIVRRGE